MSLKNNLTQARMGRNQNNIPNNTNNLNAIGQQPQHFMESQRIFMATYGLESSEAVKVQIENLRGDKDEGFYEPFMCLVGKGITKSATSARNPDDYKDIFILDPTIGYIQRGTKAKMFRSTFLALKPDNYSSVIGNSIFRKCNVLYRYLDEYGNLIKEPFIIDEVSQRTDANSDTNTMVLPRDTYFCTMQINSKTKHFTQDSRMILKGKSFTARNITDFLQEFTDDEESARLVTFSLFLTQAEFANDDLDNNIVDGKAFSWIIQLPFETIKLNKGETGTLVATSLKNGVIPNIPYSYIWTSDNENIIKINNNGEYQTNISGTTTITCRLEQNINIYKTIDVSVYTTIPDNYTISFDPVAPNQIATNTSITLKCFVFNNGIADTIVPVVFTFSNATTSAYKITDITANSVKIWCNTVSIKPLIVTATANVGGEVLSINTSIRLISG